MWRPPGCGGPWTAFSSGAVEAHPTLEYHKIKGDKTYVETPWLWRPLANCPAYPVLNPALSLSLCVCVCVCVCVCIPTSVPRLV